METIDTPEKARQVRSDFFVKPLVGLAGMGWKPTQQQWQALVDAADVLMPMGFFRARQLLETAWAMAQFGIPVPVNWSQVRTRVQTLLPKAFAQRLCITQGAVLPGCGRSGR
jgi:hypothetical protein